MNDKRKRMTVFNYLSQTRDLLDWEHSDGCTVPFKTYIHEWLQQARLLCAAHDFGGRDLLNGITPGLHNNWWTWRAHMEQDSPIYWVWGTVVAGATLPWALWRHDLGMKFLPMMPFHVILLSAIGLWYFS